MINVEFEHQGGNISALLKMTSGQIITERGIRKAWFATGKDLLGELNRATLAKPRKGNVYVTRDKAGRRRRHTASRPGESHANQTGTLRRSAGWKVRGMELDFGYGVTEPEPEYAGWVENGTRDKNGQVKMAARPSVRNSIKSNQRNTEQHLGRYVEEEFR